MIIEVRIIRQYKVIRTEKQYYEYCNVVQELVTLKKKNKQQQDTIELLTVLIEKWDEEHNTFSNVDPIRLLHSLMNDHKMKGKDLAELLDVSKGYVSDILHYKKGLSKDVIRKLSTRFKLSQEAFNQPYKLVSPLNARLKDAGVTNTRKKLSKAG